MEKDILYYIKKRYTAKVYNPNKKISDENIEKIKEILRLAPSSVNLQGWSFVIVSSKEGRDRIIKSTEAGYKFNTQKVKDSSHTIIFCAKKDIDDNFFEKVLEKEDKDKRFPDEDNKNGMDAGRKSFTNFNKENSNLSEWLARQVYLNLGMLTAALAVMEIDSTIMEGFNSSVIDEEFNLTEKGLKSLLILTMGYSDEDKDYNAKLPKSRLDIGDIIEEYK